MKNEDIKIIDAEAKHVDNVTVDVKPRKNNFLFRFTDFFKRRKLDGYDVYLIPIAIGTLVSFGFLIVQLSKLAESAGVSLTGISNLF